MPVAGLATTTADVAKAAALAALPGEVVQVELDNENGAAHPAFTKGYGCTWRRRGLVK